MEKIGLLDREVDERDARLVFVVATNAGRAKLSEALSTFSKRAGYLFGDRCERRASDGRLHWDRIAWNDRAA
ncbi:hypothetical protein [Litoreibacter roseus]|uniref:Winged helix DNA-binding protein n=1 Tax=Litoreibacter roseus TaxID=2601869 RepID=A0A6N6JCK8_9RHOB|nr:hypothetical protein [Litoreibacter roseus]GFE63149.1 hypothetical protein KIN_02230 [Litoreibacter roseus]